MVSSQTGAGSSGGRRLHDPTNFIRSAVRHRHLIRKLAVRQIRGRYIGSLLGSLWAVLQPLFLLAVFTFVFSIVFQARWGVEVHNRGHFALVLFSGLLTFNLLAHCISNAPTLMLLHSTYISKVVFPVEVLPWVVLIEGVFHAAVGFAVFFVIYFLVLGPPPLSALYLPLVILPLCVFLMGATWFFASVGVYVRDLAQVVGVLVMMLMFLSPLFYPLEAVPEQYRVVIHLSPLTFVLGEVRNVLFWGKPPQWLALGVATAVAWLAAWLGFNWFMVTKRGFSDVL